MTIRIPYRQSRVLFSVGRVEVPNKFTRKSFCLRSFALKPSAFPDFSSAQQIWILWIPRKNTLRQSGRNQNLIGIDPADVDLSPADIWIFDFLEQMLIMFGSKKWSLVGFWQFIGLKWCFGVHLGHILIQFVLQIL